MVKSNMILSFHPVIVADAQIILGDRTICPEELALIRGADAVILPQGCSRDLYRVCRESAPLLFPNYDRRFEYAGKVGQSRLFQEMGWPHPATRTWPSVANFKAEHGPENPLPHKPPFFLKRSMTHEGEGVYLIQGLEELDAALEDIRRKGDSCFISQDLVQSEGNVLRAVVMGKRTYTYWKRPSLPGRMITTVGSGAFIDKEWRPDLLDLVGLQAANFSREAGIDLAAMDFVLPLADPAPRPLILEINYYFGRRGLGGSLRYYRLLMDAVREWLEENGLDPQRVWLV